jgi:hypothetical protein
MSKVTAPLVGMHFRPPAKAILSVLPSNCPLYVVPEPDNPYDANALQVFVRSADIPESQHSELSELGNASALFGTSLAEILAQERWHLGYVKATEAVHIAPRIAQAFELQTYIEFMPATLAFDSAGKPLVAMELPA